MKTNIKISGEGIGPRGTASIRLDREYPDLVGADVKLVRDAFYSSVNKVRKTEHLTHFNVSGGNELEVPMLWAFYDPKYDSADNPVKEYPSADELMAEFNTIYDLGRKCLEKAFVGTKLMKKFCIHPNVACLTQWNLDDNQWKVTLSCNFPNLPENEKVEMPKRIHYPDSKVIKSFLDEEVDSVTEQDVEDAYNELYEFVRNSKYIKDATELIRNKLFEFQNRYLLKSSVYCNFINVVNFKGDIQLHTSHDDVAIMHFDSGKEAFEIAQKIDNEQLLKMMEERGLVDSVKKPVAPKTKEEQEYDKRKQIAKLKKRTEVRYEDFVADLERLAKQD